MQPYTYLIGWERMDVWYYGVRYAKNCDPSELWISYYTSSDVVKRYRVEFGEPDVVQVRRTFKSHSEALEWEYKVIRRMRAVKSARWLNQANANKEFNTAGKINRTVFKPGKDHIMFGVPAWNRGIDNFSDLEKKRRSIKYRGAGNPNYGNKHSDETRALMRANRKPGPRHTTPHTDEVKEAARVRTLEQMKNGTHSSQIRACCVVCKKEVSPTILTRFHQHK